MIEIGKKYITCNCIIEENNGKIVTVLDFYASAGTWVGYGFLSKEQGDRWMVDSDLVTQNEDRTMTIKTNHIGEKCLKPIDEDWDNISSWDECVWQPDHTREYSD